ncbi:MAG: hypothetical protein QXQ86_07010, partial [Sulfolobales archaeon]
GLVLDARQYLYWRKSRELGIDIGLKSVEPPTGGPSLKLALEGYLTAQYLRYKLGPAVLDKVRELSDRFRYAMTALAIAGVYLRSESKDLERLRFEVSGELGVEVPREVFEELVQLAESVGYVARG